MHAGRFFVYGDDAEMYALEPTAVYALEEVQDRPAWTERVERILGGLGNRPPEVRWFARSDVPEVAGQLIAGWPPPADDGGVPAAWRRPLVFTTMDLSDDRPEVDDILERCPDGVCGAELDALLGRFLLVRPTHAREVDAEREQVCWPTYDFGAMVGCPHGCLYCHQGRGGRFISIGVNVDEYMEQVVGPTCEEYPWQRCFRMIGWGSDLITFEPENGLFDAFTRKMVEHDRYAYFHTASDNVGWVADLPRKDRLVGVWSLTCEGVVRDVERGAGSALGRVEAGRRCQEFGIPIRYKFKPIIPVQGWRRQYAEIIEQALKRSRPESVGMCVLMWMDFEGLENVGLDLLDTDYVDAARAAWAQMQGVRTGPFPHEVRAEIYRFFIEQVRRWDADVPLYVSTESPQMWDELADELGQDPETYICGCSSVALPGGRVALSRGCPGSTYLDRTS